MYLKKIHIQGFKSFADKTEIKFKDDITAIVGPNGSGKSNISDAIRWVLGEQSVKSLRGNKMEDVIFSGTSKRRALSFSEVTIFFDNTDGAIPLDYNEVAVTRRMFRSGESEYYINKSGCRLKDVRTLFMDTGIGKDGYSIIGQGKIDEILSNKPEDRRNIFEEAAGITKYKSKKEEAERKLKNTQENLVRIDDLISEIDIQNTKLERDSKKANEFMDYFGELKNLEINLYIRDIKDLDKQSKEIQNYKNEIEKEIIENESKKDEKQNIFNLLKGNIEKKEEVIESLRNKRDKILKTKEESKNNISLLYEKENFNKKDLERLNKEIEDISAEKLILDRETSIIEEKIKECSVKHENLISKYNYEETALNKINKELIYMEEYIDNKKEELNLLYEKIANEKGRLVNIKHSNLNSEKEELNLNAEKDVLCIKIDEIKKNIDVLNYNKENLKTNLEDSIKNKLIYEKDRENIQLSLNENFKRIRELEIEIERTNSSYKLYENMQYSYEGYYKSVKNLLMAVKNKVINNKGFHGVIADLLSVEVKYETAINIALGGNAQNIVVDHENDAKFMINYLKSNKLGRVTFLPISTIRANKQNININSFKKDGVIGLAYELIEYDEKYENIFKSLLGRTIIMDNIDNSIAFAKKTNNMHRIVTLEGEVLNPGGSLSGGSYRSNISIINRNNKIDELKAHLKSLKSKLDSYKTENAILSNKLKLKEEEINTIKENINTINLENINIDNDKRAQENEKEFIYKNIERIDKQIELLIKDSKKTLESSIKDKDALKLNTDKFEKLKVHISDKTEELKTIKNKKEKINEDISSMKLNIILIENEISNFKVQIKDNLEKKEYNRILGEEKLENIISIKNVLENISKENDIYHKIVKENSQQLIEIEEDIKEATRYKDAYMEKFYEEQDHLKALNENINILDKTKNDRELSLSKLELQKSNIVTKLSEDYKLDLEEAFMLEDSIDDIESCRKRVKLLKTNIKQLGNVNVGSIEEYKEVNERLQFMKTQQSDLVESKENLRDIISDMEKEMRVNFLKRFKEIKSNFSEVFSELFNGGVASLELEDDNILVSGIEIKVQPPGKALQSLSLLSGGEKSLVAVALLFAILKTKPAPFCVLDEIDAALDDANISRYTSYLKRINEDTQIILITHRKTSMEIANVLYGVTMEEKGISRMISMKLKENELVG